MASLFLTYRFLSSNSDSFPLIGWKDFNVWFKKLEIYDNRFTPSNMAKEFSNCKVYDYKRGTSGKIM